MTASGPPGADAGSPPGAAGAEPPASAAASPPFPRLLARTMRFTLGSPRAFTPSPDGRRVAFLRAPDGVTRAHQLWVLDVAADEDQPPAATGRPGAPAERLVVDPVALLGAGEERLSDAERARRERSREGGAGVVGYACDAAVTVAAFALSSRLFLADLRTGAVRELPAAGPVLDPRPDPGGRHVAYVADRALHVVGTDGTGGRPLLTPDGPDVCCGAAEFVAAEELGRSRGFWWAPDGESLLVERYDESPVGVWHIADPAHPEHAPRPVRYPAAGTANAAVELWLVGLDGTRREVRWDHDRFPYLAAVSWTAAGPALLAVLSRDQRTAAVLGVDAATGNTTTRRETTDDCWVEVVPGTPALLPGGQLLTVEDDRAADTRRLFVDGEPVTPPGLQVESVADVDAAGVLLVATADPTESHLYRLRPDGTVDRLTAATGVHAGRAAGDLLVVAARRLDADGVDVRVLRAGRPAGGVIDRSVRPPLAPRPRLHRTARSDLVTAVLFPAGHLPGSARLPVLLDPYGGPHGQQARHARAAYLTSQWFADQGFCVVVCDGRGTPRRGPAFDRRVRDDFAATVDDQVEALGDVARRYPDDVDLARVGIRGWSFGGYLAALAVLARPDVFHAAVAGAPPTDWRLYDTCYTERYLGDPTARPDVYDHNGLLGRAADLRRPLLLIHGLADDNVVVAHTLRLSAALLAAGRPHTVLPLTGITHMTSQEVVAENLLLLQLRFLTDALARPATP